MKNRGLLKNVFHFCRRQLARFWLLLHPNVVIVGVTGSYGKTNTVRAIAAALKGQKNCLTSDINLDTVYNLPITLLKINRQTEMVILEYGVDHRGEMAFHLNLVQPDIAVLTGITPVHADKGLLGSLEGIIQEKTQLIKAADKIVLNWDDKQIRQIGEGLEKKFISYGRKKGADYQAKNVKLTKKGIKLEAHWQNQQQTIHSQLLGRHFAQEIMAALAVANLLEADLHQSAQQLEKLAPLPGRMSLEKGPRGSTLINDSLRANPASTKAGLETLAEFPHSGQRIAVLGEMGELGKFKQEKHYQIGQVATQSNLDYLITIGPATKHIIAGAVANGFPKDKAIYCESHRQVAAALEPLLNANTLWYLKGSLLKHMERIILILEGEKVDCTRISCHNYNHCPECDELKT